MLTEHGGCVLHICTISHCRNTIQLSPTMISTTITSNTPEHIEEASEATVFVFFHHFCLKINMFRFVMNLRKFKSHFCKSEHKSVQICKYFNKSVQICKYFTKHVQICKYFNKHVQICKFLIYNYLLRIYHTSSHLLNFSVNYAEWDAKFSLRQRNVFLRARSRSPRTLKSWRFGILI